MSEFKGITGPGRYRTRDGRIAVIHSTTYKHAGPYMADGYFEGLENGHSNNGWLWRLDGAGYSKSEDDIIAGPLADDPEPQEMAGLTGFAPVFKSADGGDEFHMEGVWTDSPEYALKATDEFGPRVAVIDLSKVPASAIVKPTEPKRETRKVWLYLWNDHKISLSENPPPADRSEQSSLIVSIIEIEAEFTHGEGLS